MSRALSGPIGATVLGYPRIGPNRELKKAVEAYWAGPLDAAAPRAGRRGPAGADLAASWPTPASTRVRPGPSRSTTTCSTPPSLVGAVPAAVPRGSRLTALDELLRDGPRHRTAAAPLEMTKWFDTNYHYLVPETGPRHRASRLAGDKPVAESARRAALGVTTRPGAASARSPSCCWPRRPTGAGGFDPLDAARRGCVEVYAELLGDARRRRASTGCSSTSRRSSPTAPPAETRRAAPRLPSASARLDRPAAAPASRPTSATSATALPVLAETPVEAIGLDLVPPPRPGRPCADAARRCAARPSSPGWSTAATSGAPTCARRWRRAATLLGLGGRGRRVDVVLAAARAVRPDAETALDPAVRARLAFARQKVDEIVAARPGCATESDGEPAAGRGGRREPAPRRRRRGRPGPRRLDDPADRTPRAPYAERAAAQQARLGLPPLRDHDDRLVPADRRRAQGPRRLARTARHRRRGLRAADAGRDRARDPAAGGARAGRAGARRARAQRHGPVLRRATATASPPPSTGWVQSYGSRCVRPPILHGDVSRPEPMTVAWSHLRAVADRPAGQGHAHRARSRSWPGRSSATTSRWADTADQVALALRDEIADLEAAGHPRSSRSTSRRCASCCRCAGPTGAAYLDWAVGSFRLATGGASDGHPDPHAPVLLGVRRGHRRDRRPRRRRHHDRGRPLRDGGARRPAAVGYSRGVGPGVYDIHSPRVPERGGDRRADRRGAAAVPADRLWVNPDCGLKTRGYEEVEPTLRAMVEAARAAR